MEIKDKIIFSKYKIQKFIAKGSFSFVYSVKEIQTGKLYAAKIEERKNSSDLLEKEMCFLYILKGFGIPEVVSCGRKGKYNILIEQLLGKQINLLITPKKKNLKDLCMASIQMVNLLKYIHSKYVIHRDIKPGNFLIGNPDESTIYLIDFGLSRKYRSSRSGKHMTFNSNVSNPGTLKFISLNASKGAEPARRDDIESLLYTLIYIYTGNLPWCNLKAKSIQELINKVYLTKKNISNEQLCIGLPNEFVMAATYIKKLQFTEEPNYDYLNNLFEKILTNMNETNDLNFSWVKSKKLIFFKSKSTNNNEALNRKIKKNPINSLYHKIKKSLDSKKKITVSQSGFSTLFNENINNQINKLTRSSNNNNTPEIISRNSNFSKINPSSNFNSISKDNNTEDKFPTELQNSIKIKPKEILEINYCDQNLKKYKVSNTEVEKIIDKNENFYENKQLLKTENKNRNVINLKRLKNNSFENRKNNRKYIPLTVRDKSFEFENYLINEANEVDKRFNYIPFFRNDQLSQKLKKAPNKITLTKNKNLTVANYNPALNHQNINYSINSLNNNIQLNLNFKKLNINMPINLTSGNAIE